MVPGRGAAIRERVSLHTHCDDLAARDPWSAMSVEIEIADSGPARWECMPESDPAALCPQFRVLA